MEIDFMSMTLAEIVDRSNSLSEINTRYQDVAHQIELLPMDAVTLSKKVKELKAILRERRVAKECVSLLQTMGGTSEGHRVVVGRVTKAKDASDKRIARYIKESLEGKNDTAILS